MGGCIQKNIFILFSFHNHFNLIASHANIHTNTSTGLIANNNISNAIRGLMNNIIINNNNNIIICFSLILQQQQESNPRLPLVYTANYDYLILLFLTISSRYLIRYYLSIEQQGIEPYTTLVHLITLTSCLVQLHQGTAQQLSTSSMDYTPLIRIAGLEPTLHVPKTRMLPLTLYPVTICHKNYNL